MKLTYICKDFHGTLHTDNEESLQLKFFSLDNLPELWQNQQEVLDDLLKFMKIKKLITHLFFDIILLPITIIR